MPHSILTGRPMPQPGEPLFTEDDTAAAVALAAEERDTCRSCGMLKVWCRDKTAGRARFAADEDFCWATYYVALRQEKLAEEAHRSTIEATQVFAKFRDGQEPDIEAGLNLGAYVDPESSG